MSQKQGETKSTPVYPRPRKSSVLQKYEKSVLVAFKYDCENFLDEFEKLKSFQYTDFASVWQIMNFGNVYADQNYVSELKVLCRSMFLTVKKNVILQESLYMKIGAFYLMYGLYYKQPIRGLVKIRLTLDEYKQINELMKEMKRRNCLDAPYVFAKMKCDQAFLYVAHHKAFTTKKNYIDDFVSNSFQVRCTESSMTKFKDMIKDKSIKSLEEVCQTYDGALRKYAENHPSISVYPTTAVNEFYTMHEKFFEDKNDNTNDNKDDSVKTKKQNVKMKAMASKNAVYRGHRDVLTRADLNNDASDSD